MQGFKVTARTIGANAKSVSLGGASSKANASLLVHSFFTGLQLSSRADELYVLCPMPFGDSFQIFRSITSRIRPYMFAVVRIEPCELRDDFGKDIIDQLLGEGVDA